MKKKTTKRAPSKQAKPGELEQKKQSYARWFLRREAALRDGAHHVARVLGVSKQCMSDILSGRVTAPSAEVIYACDRKLGITIYDWFTDTSLIALDQVRAGGRKKAHKISMKSNEEVQRDRQQIDRQMRSAGFDVSDDGWCGELYREVSGRIEANPKATAQMATAWLAKKQAAMAAGLTEVEAVKACVKVRR